MRISVIFSFLTCILLFPLSVRAFGGVYTDDFGNKGFEKPIGVNTLNIVQNITVFKGKGPVEACPGNPNYGPSKTSQPRPKYTDICFKGCEDKTEYVPPVYDGSGNLIGGDYNLYSRVGCTDMQPGYYIVLGGKLFAPGYGPEFDKNAQCGNDKVPNMGLIVTMGNSKNYMWDPIPPVCVRGGYSAEANPGQKNILSQTGYVEDLTGMLNELKSTALDDTLRYMDVGKEVYTGIWTNRDVEATGYCADGESGCENRDPKRSGPLYHLQISFLVDAFYDMVKNESSVSGRTCDSTVKTMDPKNIKRMCLFWIDTKFLDARLQESGYTNAEDIAYINKVKQTIFDVLASREKFGEAILKFREIALRMGKNKHFLYEIRGCKYTVEYEQEKVRGPYIDKILPTVTLVGSGQSYPSYTPKKELIDATNDGRAGTGSVQVLIDDENNRVATGVYYAGARTFILTLRDQNTSAWDGSKTRVPGGPGVTMTGNVDNPRWASTDPKVQTISRSWSGVSGIDEYMFQLDRIQDGFGKTYDLVDHTMPDGTVLKLSRPENIILTGGEMNLRKDTTAPRTGPDERIVPITLDETSGIQKAGLYRWTIYTRDVAGNKTIQYAYFYIKTTPIPPTTDPGGEKEKDKASVPTIFINHDFTDIVDDNNRSGSGSYGLTHPGGSSSDTTTGGLTKPGGITSIELKGNNIADGLIRDLAFDFTDQYKNVFLPDASLGRSIHLTLTLENSLYLNQFDRTGGSSVEIGILKNDTNDIEWKVLPIGIASQVEFINVKPNPEGKYVFHFRVYTPTAGGYIVNDGQVSDILARLTVKEISALVTDTLPPPGTLPQPFLFSLKKLLDISLFFRPLYVTKFTGDLTQGGFIEGTVQKSSLSIYKNGSRNDLEATNKALDLTFSGSQSDTFSLFAHTRDTSVQNPEIMKVPMSIQEPISSFPSLDNTFYSRLIQDLSTSVDFISQMYLATHVAYKLDGHNVFYNSAVIGKDSFYGADYFIGYQNQLKVFGNIATNASNDLIKTEDPSIVGRSPFTYAGNVVRRTVVEATRNLPLGKNITPNLHSMNGNFSISRDSDYQEIKGKKTLIIKGGDLFIDQNMSYASSDSILGVIVLTDDAGKGGTIYIDPDVTNIVGTFYTDRVIMSGKKGPVSVKTYDSTTSVDTLRNQLYLYGNIMSQNTSGGARKNPHQCPQFITACDQGTAEKYDLDYLRRYSLVDAGLIGGTKGTLIPYKFDDIQNPTKVIGGGTCTLDGTCKNFQSKLISKFQNTMSPEGKMYARYPFVIEYNPQILSNPPPIFSQLVK